MKLDLNKLIIGVLLLIIVLGGVFGKLNYSERDEAERLDRERADARFKHYQDSVRKVIKVFQEQDLAALKAIQDEKTRADRAEDQLQKANDKLKSIRFVGFGSDTDGRAGAIKDLYPSYSHR